MRDPAESRADKQLRTDFADDKARHGRVSLRLLLTLELLTLPVITASASMVLTELAALLAFSARKRLSFGLRFVSLLLCVACEGLILLGPDEVSALRGLLDQLALPAAAHGASAAAHTALDFAGRFTSPTTSLAGSLVSSLILGMVKLAIIAVVIAWFGAYTDTSELLGFFSWVSAIAPIVRSPLYILSTLLAILPSIKTDVQKSLDVSILRRGGRMALLWPGAWLDTLIDVIVRAAHRSERLASTAIARGFRLRDGLTPPDRRRLTLGDVGLMTAIVLLGALLYEVIRWTN